MFALFLAMVLIARGAPAADLVQAPAVASGPAEEVRPLLAWQELWTRPERSLGRTVRVRIQYHSRVESWNPFLTRFGSGQFAAFQAWADEQLPWIRSEFDSPAVRLFARRDGASERALDSATRHGRYEVLAIVREVFLDVPWLEVVQVLPLEEHIVEGTIIHAARARELMTSGSWKLAGLELDQAITDRLPPDARADLERMREECQRHRERDRPIDSSQDPPARTRKR